MAIEYIQPRIIEWLEQQGFSLGPVELREMMSEAIQRANHGVIDWLLNRGVPLEPWISDQAAGKSLELLLFFVNKGVRPTEQAVINAARGGQVRVLQWLKERGFRMHKELANVAALAGEISVLDWLETLGIYPDSSVAYQIMNLFGINVTSSLEWMRRRNLLPRFDRNAMYGNTYARSWLQQNRLI